jgi:hypothetical protein
VKQNSASEKLPVRSIANTALRDLGHVLRTMPGMSAYALAVLVVVSMIAPTTEYEPQHLVRDLSRELGRVIAEAALLTPYYIAVHRLLILDERPDAPNFHPGTARYLRFFAASCVLGVLYWLTVVPAAFFNSSLWWLGSFFVSTALGGMLALWFPAIAVDAADADIVSAFQRSGKLFFRLLAALWMILTPIWAAFFIGSALMPPAAWLFAGLALFFLWTACISLASRAWQWQQSHDGRKRRKARG